MRRFVAYCLVGLSLAFGPVHEAAAQSAGRGGPVTLEPQRPGRTDVYILSFGLWGPQSVFESEAKGAARVLEAQLDARGRSIVRFNGKRRFGAGPEDPSPPPARSAPPWTRPRTWRSSSSPLMEPRMGSASCAAATSAS